MDYQSLTGVFLDNFTNICNTILDLRWMSRLRQADPTALAELSNAVAVKDQKYTVRDNPSFQAATVVPACKIENFEKL